MVFSQFPIGRSSRARTVIGQAPLAPFAEFPSPGRRVSSTF